MINKIIWQTYESEYKDLPEKAKKFVESWKSLNPNWEYKYVSGKERALFVKKHFGEEWMTIYNSYKVDVLRSDLWRYMCLYINGGLYSDLDMFCKKPIESWLKIDSKFVVSGEENIWGYTQSIFASEPYSIFLKDLLNNIKDKYYQNVKYENVVDYEINEVGYVIFTNSILKTLEKNKDGVQEFLNENSKIIHKESIEHYCAGNGNIFGLNYKGWKTELF
jgi:mannosyltransferase OCH1-like enzyme